MKKSTSSYFYDGQIKKYIIQFMAIFSDMKVCFGDNDNDRDSNLVPVNIKYGSIDRVVAHVLSEHTQNKPLRLPVMAAELIGIELAPEARKGVGTVDRDVTFNRGGTFPDDVRAVYKYQPIPYRMRMELSLLASNNEQLLQMLEQILMIFDPQLQIQTSDQLQDWTRIGTVELDSIGNEINYPSGTDPRVLSYNLTFNFIVYLSPPLNVRNNIIQAIKLRVDTANANQDVWDLVTDLNRETPPYTTIYDAKQDPPPKR